MGMPPGPAPKDPDERRRRNKDPMEGVAVELPPEDCAEIPDMPLHPEHPTGEWHPYSVEFWDALANSPQAKLWISTDWQHLRETLRIYERWMRCQSSTDYVSLERAVRSRTGLMGYTFGDRQKLRIKSKAAPQDQHGNPTGPRSQMGTGNRRRNSSRLRVAGSEDL